MAYKLSIDTERTPTIFDSKLGGLPYWDFDENSEFPTDFFDKNNQKMQLLVQINFEDIKISENDELLPKEGMLQVFISQNSNVYGADFDDEASQKQFRIVYHKNINKNVLREKIESQNLPKGFDNFSTPIYKECAITFEESDESLESGIFVNANFTQEDPRENMDEEEAEKYDTVLLQLDSNDGSVNGEDYFMWGDMGIGNFFINSDALKNLDFSDVLYNWDCC